MARYKILLTNPIEPIGEAILRPIADLVLAPDTEAATLRRLAADADAVIVRTKLPDDIFDHAPRMRAAVRHGVGVDLIPVESATAHGVCVANVPGSNAEAVAEYCIASLLLLARRLGRIDAELRSKGWAEARKRADHATELKGRTLGVVGVGQIGGRVAAIAHHGFGMTVLGHQRRLDALPGFVTGVSRDRLFAESDFVVLSCPLTPETRHLVNADLLARMKPQAAIVNVSRGAVIDEAALVAALQAGRLGGAALDVFETQPLAADHPLRGFDSVLLSPHLAGLTVDSVKVMSEVSCQETVRILNGEKPINFINPECWERAVARRAALQIR